MWVQFRSVKISLRSVLLGLRVQSFPMARQKGLFLSDCFVSSWMYLSPEIIICMNPSEFQKGLCFLMIFKGIQKVFDITFKFYNCSYLSSKTLDNFIISYFRLRLIDLLLILPPTVGWLLLSASCCVAPERIEVYCGLPVGFHI